MGEGRTFVDAFEGKQFAGGVVTADARQVGQIVRSRDSASGTTSSSARGRQTSAVCRRLEGCPCRAVGEDAAADVTQSVGDVTRQTVAAKHVTHVLTRHAVTSHVRKVPIRNTTSEYSLGTRYSFFEACRKPKTFPGEIFTRATLCVSAVFAVVRCLSLRPSVCHVGGLYPHG